MPVHDKIEKIDALLEGDSKGVASLDKDIQRTQPVEGKFESVMDHNLPERASVRRFNENAKPTVEQLSRDVAQNNVGSPLNTKDLVAQTQMASQKIQAIKAELEKPDLDIKKPVRGLMRNKLTHIDESLKVALSKAGQEVPAADSGGLPSISPVGNFLDQLTGAQYQLDHLGDYLQSYEATGKELSAANLLAIQLKVNTIQQELEFFTNLLNKSLESTKTLMNVQV